ncbi:hypothetical protein ANO11243_071400 [Dothideomycetidae sp. 11243]|nr:hypothetical protein ANO11243_071400 [fungal sp. No.11243]
MTYPDFDKLPLGHQDPPFSAWGLWGKDDGLGTLNLLSPQTVREAASEIKSGERFSLKYPKTAGFGRSAHAFEHKLLLNPHVLTLDDTLSFNTQKTSQWDGLRHFAYQAGKQFYNGVTLAEITDSDSGVLGQHLWHKAGGIVGRGFLIDYRAWALETGRDYDPTRSAAIRFDDLMACLDWQMENSVDAESLHPRKGDILFIRVGYTEGYLKLSPENEQDIQSILPPATCGVHQDVRMLKWLWNSKFAAVAGDAPGWECFPPDPSVGFLYHEVLLAGWGCPIAELLWLEDLAEHCKKARRWMFFVTSAPLNVHGGVASPANMIAIV